MFEFYMYLMVDFYERTDENGVNALINYEENEIEGV